MLCSGSPSPPTLYKQADELFEANEYEALARLLRDAIASSADDAQLLWRLARALKKQADAEPKKEVKKALLHEALSKAQRAVELAPEDGSAHKWCGIALSSSSSFEGTSASIKNSFIGTERNHCCLASTPASIGLKRTASPQSAHAQLRITSNAPLISVQRTPPRAISSASGAPDLQPAILPPLAMSHVPPSDDLQICMQVLRGG